ncbi:MAG: HAMP domain-containing sensor histidine kinase [Acidobacteriota bacterium]
MSLRLRLFLSISGLVVVLVVAQWWFVRLLTRDLSSELDVVVTSVGESMLAMFKSSDFDVEKMLAGHGLAPCAGGDCQGLDVESRFKVVECLEDDCEGVASTRHIVRIDGEGRIEEHDLVSKRRVARSSTETGSRVLIERFRVDASLGDPAKPSAESGGTEGQESSDAVSEAIVASLESAAARASADGTRHGFSYFFGDEHDRPGELLLERIEEELDKRFEIHVQHQDGKQFLWLGTPSTGQRVRIPQQGFSEKLERFSQRLVFGSLGFLALGLMIVAAVSHRLTRPLRQLSGAARAVGTGALGTQVTERADGEVGEAIEAFNRMSAQLEALDARARAADAHKHLGEIGEIARGLAHTLRNPLNALGLSVEELAAQASPGGTHGDASLTAPTAALAESARRQIRRIDGSIRSFLALASQSGGVVGDVDLRELIEDVGLEALQDSRGPQAGETIKLDLQVAPDLPPLSGVEPELRAVLQALVVNAVEASPAAGRVVVTAQGASDAAGEPTLRVEIADEGEGLPPEVRERLFTPHLSTKANGSGMGLFLAHRIATNRYGGSLKLLEREAGGTRVILELGSRRPLEEAAADPVLAEADRS